MPYRLVSDNSDFNISYCNILWIILAVIIIYLFYSGILRNKNVEIGMMNENNYEYFKNEKFNKH